MSASLGGVQADTDGDEQGNACHADDDYDGVPGTEDALPLDASDAALDNDSDGLINLVDLSLTGLADPELG